MGTLDYVREHVRKYNQIRTSRYDSDDPFLEYFVVLRRVRIERPWLGKTDQLIVMADDEIRPHYAHFAHRPIWEQRSVGAWWWVPCFVDRYVAKVAAVLRVDILGRRVVQLGYKLQNAFATG